MTTRTILSWLAVSALLMTAGELRVRYLLNKDLPKIEQVARPPVKWRVTPFLRCEPEQDTHTLEYRPVKRKIERI